MFTKPGIWISALFSGYSIVIMKNNIEERTVNVQIIAKVVVDKAELPESVHEETDP